MINDENTLQLLAKGKKVLLVDDDTVILGIFKNVLSKYFTLIKTANDGDEAWQMYRKENFDLVISDIQMPKTNGIMLAKGIRARDPEQVILISSAYTEEKYLVDLLNIGVDGFLKKPVNLDNLFSTILRVLKTIQMKQERERIKFKKYVNAILNKNEEVTKSNYQKKIEQKEEIKVKLNVKDFMKNIRSSDPESYKFFQTQKETLMDSLNDLGESYDLIVYKNYDDEEAFNSIIANVEKLYSTFLHFDNLQNEAKQLLRLGELLSTITLDNTNDAQIEAFDILEFLINDIKKFVLDMFFEENVEDITYFSDSLRENITLFETSLHNKHPYVDDDDDLEFF
jgi:YesN/AraC family two-component response regulator